MPWTMLVIGMILAVVLVAFDEVLAKEELIDKFGL